MNKIDFVKEVEVYALNFLSTKIVEAMSFHTAKHTKEVVKATIEIGNECRLSAKNLEIVAIAAWFHDCGYTVTYVNHEDNSKIIAKDFLNKHRYPEEKLQKVLDCIDATRIKHSPKSPEEMVLTDADFYHLTKPDYYKYEQSLRKELKNLYGKIYTDLEWAKTNYTLLQKHTYHTNYGKNVLQKFKEVNIERLKLLLNELNR